MKKSINIPLNGVYWHKYGLIPVSKENRDFFPGYKQGFVLETDIGSLKTSMTSAYDGTKVGDREAGNYLCGGLREWYKKHPELKAGTVLNIKKLDSRRFKLIISTKRKEKEKHKEKEQKLETSEMPYLKPKAGIIEIILNGNSWARYDLIPLHAEHKSFFPGYKRPFQLETDIGDLECRVTSASHGTRTGNREKGNYICGNLGIWYSKHRLKKGDALRIEKISTRRYKLGIKI